MAAFDWYQATIRQPVNDVLEGLQGWGDGGRLVHSKGMHGYGHCTSLVDHEGVASRVLHGGSHAYPHVQFTGEYAQGGAEWIRATFPVHEVSRLDVREDFADEGAFDLMLPSLLLAAQRHRVKVDTRGDHLLRHEARTVYLGAASSAVRLRQYDKAAELRAQFAADPVRLATVPPHLTRFEAQVRPQTSEARRAFASIEPVAVMGSSTWLREAWQGVGGLALAPVQVGKGWRQSDDDRSFGYLLVQYGPMLKRKKVDHGSWEALGKQIGFDLAERGKVEHAKRRR